MLSDQGARCGIHTREWSPLVTAECWDPRRGPRWVRPRCSSRARRRASWRGARTRTARAPASRSAARRRARPLACAAAASGAPMRTGTGPVLLSSRRTWLEVEPAAGGHIPRRPAASVVRARRPRDPIPVVHAIGSHRALALRGVAAARADARINPIRTRVRHVLLVPRSHDWLLFCGELPVATTAAQARHRRSRPLFSRRKQRDSRVRESILYKSVFVQNALPDTQNSDPRTGAVGVSERVHLGCAIHVSTG